MLRLVGRYLRTSVTIPPAASGPARVLVGGLMLAALALSSACSTPGSAAADRGAPLPASDPIDVAVVEARTGAVESALEITGSLAPRSRVAVFPKIPGTLENVRVQLGDRVREGATLATLDPREVDAQFDAAVATVNVAEAGLEAAEAGLANAAREHERASNLFDKGAIPRQRLEGAETGLRAARAQRDLARASVAQAEAARRRAGDARKDMTLTSPISGLIVERNYDPGSLVGRGDRPVVAVADMRTLTLEAGVSELVAGRLRVGMRADVSVAAKPGSTFPGRVAAIAPEVDERNRHFRVELRVDNPGEALLPGMYATARIVTDTADPALVVPASAVATRTGQTVVYAVAGGEVALRVIETGLAGDGYTQVLSGLNAGDLIVADARRELAPGTRVRPIQSPGR